VWPKVAPWIAQAVGEEYVESLEIIKQDAMRGTAQIWVGHSPIDQQIEVVCVTEVHILGKTRTCVVRWLAGIEVELWSQELEALIENWAKHHECLAIQVWGRKGWERVCKPLGYSHSFTVLHKRLDLGVH